MKFYFDRMPCNTWLSPEDVRSGRRYPKFPRALLLNLYWVERYSPRD